MYSSPAVLNYDFRLNIEVCGKSREICDSEREVRSALARRRGCEVTLSAESGEDEAARVVHVRCSVIAQQVTRVCAAHSCSVTPRPRTTMKKSVYEPDPALTRKAYVRGMQQYHDLHRKSTEDPASFWSDIASQFHWEVPYDVNNFCSYNFDLDEGPISIKWMEGAKTNICYNLLDRNIQNGMGDKIAFYW